MHIRLGRHALVLCLAAATIGPVQAQWWKQAVEIGGVSLGMSMDEYRKVASTAPGFQLGGISSSGSGPQAVFTNGRLVSFKWQFPAAKYASVREAVRARYPSLACGTEGGTEVCTLGDGLILSQRLAGAPYGTLILRR